MIRFCDDRQTCLGRMSQWHLWPISTQYYIGLVYSLRQRRSQPGQGAWPQTPKRWNFSFHRNSKNVKICCHQILSFKLKTHWNRFGWGSRPTWTQLPGSQSLRCSPDLLVGIPPLMSQ